MNASPREACIGNDGTRGFFCVLSSTCEQYSCFVSAHEVVLNAVNNVGANIRKATVEYTAEDYSYIQRTNLESAYNLTQVGLL